MAKTKIIDKDKWIQNTALIFYQIFSVDYENEAFINKILSGGGGNSTLCSTWMHLVDIFISHRISENAYNLLLENVADEDKGKIRLENDTVYISKKIYKKYHGMFFNNAKGSTNRKSVGKYFHFDHNPSNKKVLKLLSNKIITNKNNDGFFEEFTEYVKNIQTIDLITVEEDDIRTLADKRNKEGPLTSTERDNLLNTNFFTLIEE